MATMVAEVGARGLTGSASQVLIGAAAVIFTVAVGLMLQQAGVGARGDDTAGGDVGVPPGDAGVPLPGFQLSAFADQPDEPDR